MPRDLSSRLRALEDSPMEVITSLLRSPSPDLIRLHAGEPSHRPPLEVIDDVLESMRLQRTYAYAPAEGLPELREAIAEDLGREGIRVSPDEVMVTPSGSSAIFLVLSALLDPGDEVVLIDPTFMMYRPIVEYLGGRVRWARAGEGFQPDPEALKEAIGERTKAVILVDPDNPTGRLLRPDVARAVAELAQDKGVYLLVDEAYRTIVYEGRRANLYDMAPDVVVGLGSFSKDPGVPGLRLGYIYGPREVMRACSRIDAHAFFGPSNLSQLFVLKYLTWEGRWRFIESVVSTYRERRDLAVSALRKYVSDARFSVPQGSMYVYADLSPTVKDSNEFARALASRYKVAVMPGTAFGPSGFSYVRVTFVSEPPERLEEGIRRIGLALEGEG